VPRATRGACCPDFVPTDLAVLRDYPSRCNADRGRRGAERYAVTTRVLVVADIRLYREGLAQILGREEELKVVGTAAGLEEAVTAVPDLRPEVVLIDQAMPESLAAVRAIRVLAPGVRVVALAMPDTDQHVIACAEAGVVG